MKNKKLLKEQTYGKYNPIPFDRTVDEHPVLAKIKQYCGNKKNFPNSRISEYTIAEHPGTKQPVLYRKADDGSPMFIYQSPAKGVVLEKSAGITDLDWCTNALGINNSQQSVIDNIIKYGDDKGGGYTNTFPGAGEVGPGKKYTAYDLNTINPQVFPIPEMFFVYKQSGIQTKKANVIGRIEDSLKNSVFTSEEPLDSSLLSTGRPLGTLFPEWANKYPKELNTTIWRKEGFPGVDKKTCRVSIEELYKSLDPNFRISGKELDNAVRRARLKDDVSYCITQFKFGSVAGIGMGDEVKKLLSTTQTQNKSGLYGWSVYGNEVTESLSKLKNLVKENLIKTKKIKEKQNLIQEKIVKKRLNSITENKLFVTDYQKRKLAVNLISEMFYLSEQGVSEKIINEQFMDFLKSILGSGGESVLEIIKEFMARWVIKELTPMDPNGWLAELITISFANLNLSDIGKLTDCSFVTKFLAKSITETITSKMISGSKIDGGFTDFIRNAIFDSLDKSNLGQSVENVIADFICPKLPNIKEKMNVMGEKMKSGALKAATE